MSAEGMGLILGFASLFITLVVMSMAGGRGYGKLQEQSKNTIMQLDKLIETNTKEHEKLTDCLKEINGTVRVHSEKIEQIEAFVKNGRK